LSAIVQDIENAIIQPLENFIEQAIGDAVNTLTQLMDPLFSAIQTTLSTVWSDIVSAVHTVGEAILSGLSELGNSVLHTLSVVSSTIQSVLSTVWSDIVSAVHTVGEAILSGLSELGNTIFSGLDAVSNIIRSDVIPQLAQLGDRLDADITLVEGYVSHGLTSVLNALQTGLLDIEHFVGNLHTDLVSGFNQFSAYIAHAGEDVLGGLRELGTDIWRGLDSVFNTAIKPAIDDLSRYLGQLANYGVQAISKLFTIASSGDPHATFNATLEHAIEIGTLISGIYGVLAVAENVDLLSNMQFVESAKRILEIVGIAEIPTAVTGLLIDTGIKSQFEYAVNYEVRPRKVDLGTAQRAVWYGERSVSQLREDIQYEGYNEDATNAHIATLYRPLPPFILEKLIELQMIDNDFAHKQILMEGFDPADSDKLLQAFTNLELQSFQGQAKSLVYQLYRDGYLNQGYATTILKAFAVPESQIKWILAMATYEYNYQQKLKIQTYVLDAMKKGVITPDAAVQDLVSLGVIKERADVLVKIEAAVAAPPPAKTERLAIIQEALKLPLAIG